MHKHQHGMTTIGFILVLAVLGLIAFGVIQMVPVYLENMKIVQVLNQTKSSLDGQNATVTEIRDTLEKRVDIEGLREVKARKDFEIKRSANGFNVSVDYERRRAYIANIYLLAVFDYSVEIVR
jgi:hypothetical protein